MIKNKFKRILNGVLATVMCVSTLTAVSYVQPMTASADNGNVYYNPALRWLQYDTDRVSTALTANALITQGPMHCVNAMCPSNRPDGYYMGVDDYHNVYVAPNGPDDAARWYWIEEDGTWTWAKAIWGTYEDEDGNEVKYVKGYSHEGLGGDNTGTAYSRTQMTVYRTPEYTKGGFSGYQLKTGETRRKANGEIEENYISGYGVSSGGKDVEGYIDYFHGNVFKAGDTLDNGNVVPTLMSPRVPDGYDNYGQYTGHHFTSVYCQSCGIWNSSDPGLEDRVLNNGNWSLNECQMFDTKQGLNVKSEVTRTYGHGAHKGKDASGTETDDNDKLYHRSLDNQQTQACKYCFGTQKKDASGNWVSLNREEDMYLYNEHEYHDWGIRTEATSPYTISITRTCNGDAIADFGCGYTETDIYQAEAFVDDYIGVVDGEKHYPSFGGVEQDYDASGKIMGNKSNKTLSAVLTWEDGEPPMRITAGSASGNYTITYTLPAGTDTKDTTVFTQVKGTATVTLNPQASSYSAEGNKNFYNNNNASGYGYNSGVLSSLYNSLLANGWSGTVASGGAILPNGTIGSVSGTTLTSGVVSTSSLVDGYSYIIDTDAGIGTYAAYVPVTRTIPDPTDNTTNITGVFIETGTCNERGLSNPHECQYLYSNNGIDYWKCIYCNSYLPIEQDRTYVYIHSHSYYKIDEIPATCVAKGKVYRKCVCGDIIIEDTPIDYANHIGTAHVVSPEATCEDAGYEYDQCTGCGAKLNGAAIPKLGHQWSITATSQGYGHEPSYVIQTCERCNKQQTIMSNGIMAAGGTGVTGITDGTTGLSSTHTAHNYVYKYDQTEDDNTYQIWQCDVCGDIEKRLLEATGHHFEYKYTERDCTTGVYEIWQCTGCGEIEKRMTEAASGHVWVEQSGGRESTCNINGFRNYICSKCGNKKLEMLPLDSNNHQHVSEVFEPAPTCTEAGRSYERCTDCGTNISNTWLPALGHDYKELLDSEPTCFEKGYNVKQCTRCYEVVTVEKAQLEHHYVETGIVNESQCTVDGLKELECEYCKTKKYESVSMTGHTPGRSD